MIAVVKMHRVHKTTFKGQEVPTQCGVEQIDIVNEGVEVISPLPNEASNLVKVRKGRRRYLCESVEFSVGFPEEVYGGE